MGTFSHIVKSKLFPFTSQTIYLVLLNGELAPKLKTTVPINNFSSSFMLYSFLRIFSHSPKEITGESVY